MVTRVRFAPSPTGYLHIGGLRTALYDYLLAKKDSGAFVLRIEDSGPYIQSERLSIYSKYSQQLLDSGHAYHCFCTQEDLTTMRAAQTAAHQLPRYDRRCLKLSPDEVKQKLAANLPHVIRLKV